METITADTEKEAMAMSLAYLSHSNKKSSKETS